MNRISSNTGLHRKIDIERWININNCAQFVSIKGNDINNPFLLILHGGPGDASFPLVCKFNQRLEEHYNVIVWEQRGCGKSYYRFTKSDSVNIELFIDDLYQIIQIILKKFGRQKLFLTAHSWGSVLGLKFITRYPELVYAYIGCGQVVNMRENMRLAYEFALRNTTKKQVIKKLKKADYSCSGDNWYSDLMLITRQVIRHKGSLYKKSNYNEFIMLFMTSEYYSFSDLIKRTIGSDQSIKFLWKELMEFNMEDTLRYNIPVIFMEGRYDNHVSSQIAYNYYKAIQSDKSFYWFEKSAHFPQWEEADKYNSLMIKLKSLHSF